jgi:hypothetical protein
MAGPETARLPLLPLDDRHCGKSCFLRVSGVKTQIRCERRQSKRLVEAVGGVGGGVNGGQRTTSEAYTEASNRIFLQYDTAY